MLLSATWHPKNLRTGRMWQVAALNGEVLSPSGCWQLKKRRLKNTAKEEDKQLQHILLPKNIPVKFYCCFLLCCVLHHPGICVCNYCKFHCRLPNYCFTFVYWASVLYYGANQDMVNFGIFVRRWPMIIR